MAIEHPLTINFGRELDLLLAKLMTKGIVFAVIVAVIALIQMFMNGITNHQLIMLAGAVLSGVCIFGLVAQIVRDAQAGGRQPSFLSTVLVLGGFVPYLFGSYLCFYEGIWKLVHTFEQFSLERLIAAAFYTIAGYLIVLSVYKVSEFQRSVQDNKIMIKK